MLIDADILYEDNHLIAVNKKVRQIVQGDKTGDLPLSALVKEYIKKKYHKPGEVYIGVPHRLDRPVSGVIIFAKTSKALIRLNELFKNKTVTKKYYAIVDKHPPKKEDKLEGYIYRDTKKNKSFVRQKNEPDTKFASLSYKLINSSEKFFLLEIDLHTGRHHQIRCQLADIGCPIRGDLKYGYQRANKNMGINLHAIELSFIHPVKKELITINAPLPEENIWKVF
ncbi:MAG: RluA family pseudouridine synthase [Bacteroidales bacterium]|nr:RluA family pseudouridine synthase [Bacteroidales bacterium]MDD4217827.1 RluA family pseudouridine synthase [Bacteroidales bacterium]MDY0143317.1 RluA family pseudouridine synthase [Bacteroidales bacterium]